MITIQVAQSDEEINRCYVVMSQLRPHIAPEDFLPLVRLQQQEGYWLAFLADDGEVKACAGYRYETMLAHGKFLYVDDLVTDDNSRSKGYGDAIFDWLVAQAKAANCVSLQLDSGVQRFEAHRFYFRKRMHIASYHFTVKL